MCDGIYEYPRKNDHSIKLLKVIIISCGNKKPSKLFKKSFGEFNERFISICLDVKVEH